ncbi:unnamed protein product [Ixodes hexagonus]
MSREQGTSASPIFKDVDGFYVTSFLHEDTVRSALAYKPRPDDIFIVTYPKCGTTWTQFIVHSILNDGAFPEDFVDLMLRSPWLELLGAEAAEKMVRPGAIKCHLPFHKQPYSVKAKYIYVARNPYDCCVSYYYHLKSFTHYGLGDAPFGQFLEVFLSGRIGAGDYFDHLLSWYKHRNDPNVLLFRYEDLKMDVKTWVLKIADFLGEEYGAKLRCDDVLLERVVKNTNFESLKKPVNEGMKNLVNDLVSLPLHRQLTSIQLFSQRFSGSRKFVPKENFIRKGIIGDYSNHFSAENIRRMKEHIALKTKDSDVMNLWTDIGLP